MTTSRERTVAYGPAAIDALCEVVEEAKAGDPLAPVTVVPPHVYSGLSLRRALARRGGVVNTRFMPLGRVAELLGAGALAEMGRRPLTSAVRGAAIRAVLDAEPGAFAEVAHSAATVDALDAVFDELAPLADASLDRVAGTSARAAEVVRLFRAWRRHRAAFYDEHDLTAAAANAVAAGASSLRDLGAIVLFLPPPSGPHAAPLVDAFRRAGRLFVIAGEASGEPPLVDRIVVAPTPEEEVRVAVRDLARLGREGVPLHRVALVSPGVDPYGVTAADVLAEAGLPWHGPAGRTLAHTVAGRVLLGILGLRDARFSRRDVAAWLHSGPVVAAPGDGLAPADRWDRRSRQAGITGGERQWRERLERLAARLDRRSEEARMEGDDERADRRVSAAAEARALAVFVDELFRRVRPPVGAAWGGWGEWAVQLLHRYLGGEAAHARWPDHEIEAYRGMEAALEGLGVLDDLESGPDLPRFRAVVERELRAPAPRTTRFGDGVFVGRVGDVVGTDFDAVYVLGMAEGAFPSPLPVGLLTESERARAGEAVESAATAKARELHAWLAGLAGPTRRVLSTPAADPRAGRARHASPWLLEAAERLHGRPVFAQSLAGVEAPWLEVVASAEDGLRHAADPASLVERDTLALLAGLDVPEVPALARGFEVIAARAGVAAGPWEGLIGEAGDLFSDRVLSATSLERWAECPFRYYLEHVLRVDVLDDPEDIETLSPADRGSLVHAVLEELVRGGDPDALEQIVSRHFAEWEGKGRTGRSALWELEQRRIRRILAQFVAADAAHRGDFVPAETEFAFNPLEVDVGRERPVRLRGYIDRIDTTRDGSRVRVIDYKTGRPVPAELGPTQLQLAVYSLAARQRYGDVPVDTEYWYLSDQDGFTRDGYEVTDEVVAEFVALLGRIVAGVEAGVFPAHPGDDSYHPARGFSHENCLWCPYDRVCTADRADAWERLASQAVVEPYTALIGPA